QTTISNLIERHEAKHAARNPALSSDISAGLKIALADEHIHDYHDVTINKHSHSDTSDNSAYATTPPHHTERSDGRVQMEADEAAELRDSIVRVEADELGDITGQSTVEWKTGDGMGRDKPSELCDGSGCDKVAELPSDEIRLTDRQELR
ncbi:hypothetical protein SARC_10447, partial [Sphaeroforma arctica JP610]